jgi:septal ring factor EnvC (AmiA/AmiB activator)
MRISFIVILSLIYFIPIAKSDINEIKEKINKEKEIIKSIDNEKKSIISQLNEIDKRLFESRQELNRINSELYIKRVEINKIERKIEDIEERISKERRYLNKRLVSLYKLNRIKYVKILFSSVSYNELFKRVKYLNIIIENDNRIIGDFKNNIELLDREKNNLELEREKLKILRNKATEESLKIDFEKGEKLSLLSFIEKERSTKERLLKELEEAAKNLESKINRSLEREFEPKEDFGKYKGKLNPPLKGKIISLFGKIKDPKFNTYIYNNGIEIKVPIGTKIRSVFEGKVVYSGWLKGYGELIIIDHGNHYYTLYAHTSRLFKGIGDIVRKGEVIALSGDSGSLKGPSLYFEIRRRGIPENPLNWLNISKYKNFGRRK